MKNCILYLYDTNILQGDFDVIVPFVRCKNTVSSSYYNLLISNQQFFVFEGVILITVSRTWTMIFVIFFFLQLFFLEEVIKANTHIFVCDFRPIIKPAGSSSNKQIYQDKQLATTTFTQENYCTLSLTCQTHLLNADWPCPSLIFS